MYFLKVIKWKQKSVQNTNAKYFLKQQKKTGLANAW